MLGDGDAESPGIPTDGCYCLTSDRFDGHDNLIDDGVDSWLMMVSWLMVPPGYVNGS